MAPTKKEKTKTDLEEAVFKFSDKKEELEELLDDPPDEHGVLNAGLVNSMNSDGDTACIAMATQNH